MEPAYTYRAICTRVIDGDTFVLTVDLGFRCSVSIEARLRGIDAPERNTDAGKQATAFVQDVIAGRPLLIESYRDERSFARWVCEVWVGDDSLAELLRAAGFEKNPQK